MKNNLLVSAAIAGLMATSAFAADKAKSSMPTPKNEKECTSMKGTWKDGKCEGAACGAHGCGGSTDASATQTAPATQPAPAAPAKK